MGKANQGRVKKNKSSSATSPNCKDCGKFHLGKCWSVMVCGKCGKKGHPDWKCEGGEKKEKSTSSNESLAKQLEKFSGDKVELVKLFERSKK